MSSKKTMDIRVAYLDDQDIQKAAKEGKVCSWHEQQLSIMAHKLLLTPSYNRLQAIETKQCQIRIMPHQVGAAFKVMNEMEHRAILADEVGLGKTIEAGILIKEYLCRGLINSALILAPVGLLYQWREEMLDKFDLHFVLDRQDSFHYDKHPFIIGSLEKSRLPHYQEEIFAREWGLVIIDEAHKTLRNPRNETYKFVKRIPKKYFLLLTATPLQTGLLDLWSLAHLINPGIIGTRNEFRKNFVADNKWRRLKNPEQLGIILRKVIVRTRRSEAGVRFVERFVQTRKIKGYQNEYEIQDVILNWIQNEYSQPEDKRHEGAVQRTLLLREAASSIQATLSTLHVKFRSETKSDALIRLQDLIRHLEILTDKTEHSKAKELLSIQSEFNNDKLLVFVQYRATQQYIVDYLAKREVSVKGFRGDIDERKSILKWFEISGQVLICCDSTGAEGLNLQDTCHIVVNYDLPWNPMAIEQRIGRVHRIGQKKSVRVFNLVVQESIEEYVLTALFERINLFRLAIGDMDLILGMNELEGTDMETMIAEAIANGQTKDVIRANLTQLAEQRFVDPTTLRKQLDSFHDAVFSNFRLNAFSLQYED